MDDDRVEALTRTITAFGLPGAPEPKPVAVGDEAWPRLLSRVRTERITGLAVDCEASGLLSLSDQHRTELLDAHRDAMAWCLSIERKLVALAQVFDTQHIPFAVLKGASVAHVVYPDPCLRSFADLDLFVGSGDYERACTLLDRVGHVRRQPEPRPGFDARFGRASVHIHPDDRIEVDLHRTPGWGPFAQWIHADELLDRAETFALGGRRIGRLDGAGMLLNVAMHASLGTSPPRLVPLRDIMQVTLEGDVDWDVLSRWGRGWHLTAVLRHAFATASTTLGVPVPFVAQRLVSDASKRGVRALAAYTGGGRDQGGTAVATLRAIEGVRPKLSYVFALIAPRREFLAARGGPDGTSYVRRWRVPARWTKRWVARMSKSNPG